MDVKRNLHPIEIFVNGLIASLLVQNYSALFYMNFKKFDIPDSIGLELAHLMNRTVLYPGIILLFLNACIKGVPGWRWLGYILVFVLILSFVEGLEHLLGIVVHTDWKAWWSLLIWLAILLLNYVFALFFRSMMVRRRETR